MKANLYTLILSILVCLIFCYPSCAQEDQKLDDILRGFEGEQKAGDELQEVIDGFEDETPADDQTEKIRDENIATKAASLLPSFLSIDGYLKLSSVYAYLAHEAAGTDTSWRGLTRLRPEIKLELDADLSEAWQARVSGHVFYDAAYSINGRDNYISDVLDNYEKELEFDEVYLQGSLIKDLDLKAGRQIVVWGRSDNIRITDVLNPLDLRWPGLVDIEKLRLPVTMTKLDYYIKGWSLFSVTPYRS